MLALNVLFAIGLLNLYWGEVYGSLFGNCLNPPAMKNFDAKKVNYLSFVYFIKKSLPFI